MTHEQLIERLKASNRIKLVIIILLLVLIVPLALIVNSFLHETGGHGFREPIDEPVAIQDVDNLRTWPKITRKSSKGVWYDSSVIENYLHNIYPMIKERMMTDSIPPNYQWKVGFYWMMGLNHGKTQRKFCVLPILVNTKDSTDVIDYFADSKKIYKHPSEKLAPPASGNAYDNGGLWP
jgi:hypothetical protein